MLTNVHENLSEPNKLMECWNRSQADHDNVWGWSKNPKLLNVLWGAKSPQSNIENQFSKILTSEVIDKI